MAAPSRSASASPIMGSSGAVLVMKPANIAAVFFRSSSASSYWSKRNRRTMAGAICGSPRIWPASMGAIDVQHVRRRHAHCLRDDRALIGAVTRMAGGGSGRPRAGRSRRTRSRSGCGCHWQRLSVFSKGSISDWRSCSCSGTSSPSVRPARAQSDEAFARDEHLARGPWPAGRRSRSARPHRPRRSRRARAAAPGRGGSASSISEDGLMPSPTRFAAKASQALAA